MKKYILIFIAAAVFVGCDMGKKDKAANITAQMMVSKDSTKVELIDSVYNFGTIAEGEKVEYSFRFKNIGNKPLVVTETHASCGCTVPEKPEKPILAGEAGLIKVVFNSKGKEGHQEKSIMVSSNANPPFRDLKLVGEVKTK